MKNAKQFQGHSLLCLWRRNINSTEKILKKLYYQQENKARFIEASEIFI